MTIDQDKDVLAAEYVLGTLSPDERAEAQALIAIDTSFADVVRGWERRLGELSAMVDPVEPPSEMWGRIKAGIAVADQSAPRPDAASVAAKEGGEAAPAAATTAASAVAGEAEDKAKESEAAKEGEATPASAEAAPVPAVLATPVPAVVQPTAEAGAEIIEFARRANRWRAATGATGLLAACLAALLVTGSINPDLLPAPLRPKQKVVEVVRTVEVPAPAPAEFVAVFQKDDASPAFLLTFDLAKSQFTVRRVGAEPQAGRSYELWLVSDKFGGQPRSLGVIGTAPYTVRPALPEYDPVTVNRATFGISLEPEGGSPTGRPTEVLYHGKLMQTTPPEFPSRTP